MVLKALSQLRQVFDLQGMTTRACCAQCTCYLPWKREYFNVGWILPIFQLLNQGIVWSYL